MIAGSLVFNWFAGHVRTAWRAGSSRSLLVALATGYLCVLGLPVYGQGELGQSMHPRARTLETADGLRRYSVWLPDAEGQRASESTQGPPALLVALHGNGGDGSSMAAMTRFHELGRREGFVVAYPDGLSGSWNYVRGVPGYPAAPDDVSFLGAMVEGIEREFGTDPRRRYVAGYSNGGFMAQRLACDAAESFAGFVSVAAGGFAGLDLVCGDPVATSLLLVHGTGDRNVPWEGLPAPVPGGTVYITWPVPESFAYWARRAGCPGPLNRRELPGDVDSGFRMIVVLELDRCEDQRQVTLYGLVGGGHVWPQTQNFDATETAWMFLRDQIRP